MAPNLCKLCCSSNTKLTSSLTDSLIVKLFNYLRIATPANDEYDAVNVCQLCYGKAKISCDFISRIVESQKNLKLNALFENDVKKEPTPAEVLQKMQRNSGISIKKVTKQDEEITIEDSESETENLLEEVEEAHEQVDERSVASSDEVFEVIDDSDSDKDFKPYASQKKKSSKGQRASTTPYRGVFIDAPINFTCAKCKNCFISFDELSTHMKEKSCLGDEAIVCKMCSKVFQTKKNLYAHMQSHRPKQKLICDECAKEFSNQFDLDQHKESIHHRVVKRGDFTYRCTHCQEAFSSHFELLEHVKEHSKERKDAPRLCEICARLCPNLKAYQSHISHHQPPKRPFVCEICGKAFTKSYLLTQHNHVHTGIKAFSCDICSKSYAKRDSLRIHKKKEHPA